MDTKVLKRGLWGYSPISVSEYIAGMNLEFSQKILDIMAEQEAEKKELREKVAQLERENQELRNPRNDVTAILEEARNFAAHLNEEAEAEMKKKQEENEERIKAEQERIRIYGESIDVLRDELRGLLKKMDAELEKKQEQIAELEK